MLKILVVEDSATFASMLRGQLMQMYPGAEVATADSVDMGLFRLDSERFDVLLLDLYLGESTPEQTVAAYSATMHRVPTVVVTGHTEFADIVKDCQLAGAERVIPKRELSFTVLRLAVENAILRNRQSHIDTRLAIAKAYMEGT